jgi:membrane protein
VGDLGQKVDGSGDKEVASEQRARTPHWRSTAGMLDEALDGWITDNVPRLSASLAFYTLLSMAPLLVLIVAIAAFVYGQEAAQGQLMWQIRGMVGSKGAAEIQDLVRAASKTASGPIAAVVGIITMLFGASAVVLELQDALNTIWRVPQPQGVSRFCRILAVVKERFYAFGLILGAGLLLLISLALNAFIAAAGELVANRLPESELLLHVEAFVVSFVVITGIFAAIYKLMPAVKLQWGDVIIGAAFTALVFTAGKQLIAMYLGKVGIESPYGAAGALVAILVWVYYSAQCFFLGAEFTKVYTKRHGSWSSKAHGDV